ncbi:MAG: universal stress protein, partial [Anaerolineae bacterium]|nr:universal stress protein [Anaerolineae bacterium]
MPEEQASAELAPLLDDLPPVAESVVVPIANPATAEGLLRLALSLVNGEGRVIAAFVTVHGTEPRPHAEERLREILTMLEQEGHAIELATDMATSIARGILDIAQEHSADLIVLGVRGLQQDKVVLGPVVDAVARTAPCNVLVYRGMKPLYGGEGYHDVIVPVDGSQNSRLAARIGLRFALHADAPLTALYVQADTRMRRSQALGYIEASLEGLMPEHYPVRKLVERSGDVVTGILNRCDETDLVVLGFSEESSLDN